MKLLIELILLITIQQLTIHANVNEPPVGSDDRNMSFSNILTTTETHVTGSSLGQLEPESFTPEEVVSTTMRVNGGAPIQSLVSSSLKSTKNAYILLIGLSGCGKSSTLNFLFGNRQIAPVKNFLDSPSDSKHVREYVIEAPLELPGSKLHIIDTKGIGPPNGLNENADVITSLKSFLENHVELSHVIPNVVLIFTRFDDNRIDGKGSSFVQMLTTYGVIAPKFLTPENSSSNAIFVLTRVLSAGRTLSRNPNPRFNIFQSVIEKYTSKFPHQIVFTVVDNAAEEEELDEDDEGNFHLPNKELYPKNLIERMIDTCKKSNDSIGESILKSVFAQRKTIPFEEVEINAAQSETNQSLHQDIISITQNIERTQVSMVLAEAYQKIPQEIRDSYPGALLSLQKNLQNKGIKFESQIPREPSELILFLQELSMDVAMVSTFERAFVIEVPKYPFNLLTGQSYNILKDEVIEKSPFDLRDLKFSSAGFMIPKDFTFTYVSPIQEETVFGIYFDNSSYINARMQALGVSIQVDTTRFTAEVIVGNNLATTWSKSFAELNAMREFVTFKLELNDDANFNEEFLSALQLLPKFDLTDHYVKQIWKNFLEEYGTHIITKADAGGGIGTFLTVRDEELNKLRHKDEFIRAIYNQLPFNNDFTRLLNRSMINSLKLEFSFEGGFEPLTTTTLDQLNLTEAKNCIDQWKTSLATRPIQLRKYLRLTPLSEFVKKIYNSIGADMRIATEAFLTGQLDYVATPTRTNQGSPPEQEVPDSSGLNAELVKELQELLQSQKNQAQIFRDAIKKIRIENGEEETRPVTMLPVYTPRQTTQIPNREIRPTTTTESTKQKTQSQQWAWHTEITTVPPIVTSTETSSVYEDRLHNLRCSRNDGCFKQTGYGYDAFLDEILESTPLTSYGDTLCKYLPMDQPNPYVPHYMLKQFGSEYLYNRQGQTKFEIEHTTKPGVDKNLQSGQNIHQKLSIIIEFRTFKNELKLGCSAVKQEFTNFVYDLPKYRRTSCYAVSKWRELFARYGTHLVNSSYVGGAIEILPEFKLMDYIRQNYPHYDNEVEKNNFFHNIQWDQMKFEIITDGGDGSFFNKSNDFSHQNLRTWKDSLLTRGVPLETDFTTVPIVSLLSSIPSYLNLFTSYSSALIDYKNNYFTKYCNTIPRKSCQTKKLEGTRVVTLFDSKCFLGPWVICRDNLNKEKITTHFCGKNLICIFRHYGYVCDCDTEFTLKEINSTRSYECIRT